MVAAAGFCAIKELINAIHQPEDSAELFWQTLQANHRPLPPAGPVITWGYVIAENIFSLQKQIFSECHGRSQLLSEYVQIKGRHPKHVIDLGCGIGSNSIPLLKQGATVTAIDKMACLLKIYRSNVSYADARQLSLKCADLTTLKKYSPQANVADVVLATDVLPYLPIIYWKSTLEKITASLKPGGYFFSTVFVKNTWLNHPLIAIYEKHGANYYAIDDLASRLIQYSGLEMLECRLRKEGHGCYEFVVRRP